MRGFPDILQLPHCRTGETVGTGGQQPAANFRGVFLGRPKPGPAYRDATTDGHAGFKARGVAYPQSVWFVTGGKVSKVSALQEKAGVEQGVVYLHGFQLPDGCPSGERPVPGF